MDGKSITRGLEGWSDQELLRAKEDVKQLLEHPGWLAVVRATEDYGHVLHKAHLSGNPTDSAAKYADAIGHMKGLRELEGIAKGIVTKGDQVEHVRRAMEEAA